jgi:hypothetical protein
MRGGVMPFTEKLDVGAKAEAASFHSFEALAEVGSFFLGT